MFSQEHLVEINCETIFTKHHETDYEGYFNDDYLALALRGSEANLIIDRQQPFQFGNDRYCLVFNGEIH